MCRQNEIYVTLWAFCILMCIPQEIYSESASGQRIVVKKPHYGSLVELYCDRSRTSEYLAFQFAWYDEISSVGSEQNCRNATITSFVNGNPMNVAEKAFICSSQDYVWVVRSVCQDLWPFKEGNNDILLEIAVERNGDIVDVQHKLDIHVEPVPPDATADDVRSVSRQYIQGPSTSI